MSRKWSSSEGDGDGSESLSESNAAICVEDLLDENDLFLWMIFAVFCIQGDSLDIASLHARPFQNFVRALDLHRSHPTLGVLQRARLEVLFASETAVCARDLAGSTAHATAAHTATAPFSARAMRFSQVIGRSPLRTHDSFPAAMARDLAPASSARKSSSTSSSALVRAVKDRLASTPGKNSSLSSSTSLASNASRPDRTAQSASAATAADPWAKLFASPLQANASTSAQTPRQHPQQRPKTANTLSGTGYNHVNNSDTVDLGVLASGDRPRPAKSVSFAGFKRLLLRLSAALKPNSSPVDALQWLLDLMRQRMQPRLDNGKIGIVQMLRAEDSPVRALMTQVDDCFREWYAFFADAMLVQGGMSLMQFMRCINELHWLDNGVRSLSTYALAEIFLFSSSKSLDSSAALALSSSAYSASSLDSTSSDCALLPRGIMSFDDFREALVRVASAEFSRRAHPQLPTEYKIKALLHNVYLAHRAEGLQFSSIDTLTQRALQTASNNAVRITQSMRQFAIRVVAMTKADGNVDYLEWMPPPPPPPQPSAPRVLKLVRNRNSNGADETPNQAESAGASAPSFASSSPSSSSAAAADRPMLSGLDSLQQTLSATPTPLPTQPVWSPLTLQRRASFAVGTTAAAAAGMSSPPNSAAGGGTASGQPSPLTRRMSITPLIAMPSISSMDPLAGSQPPPLRRMTSFASPPTLSSDGSLRSPQLSDAGAAGASPPGRHSLSRAGSTASIMSRSASLSSASLTMTTMRAHSRGKSLMHSMLSMGADGIEQAFSSSIGGSFSNGPDIGNIDLLSDRGSVGSDIGDSIAPSLLRTHTGAVSSSWLSPSLARDQWNGVAPAAAGMSFVRSLRSPSIVAASLAPK